MMNYFSQVLRKLLKTYGTGLQDSTSEPEKASMSLSAFFLRTTLQTAVVCGTAFVIYRAVRREINDGYWQRYFMGIKSVQTVLESFNSSLGR